MKLLFLVAFISGAIAQPNSRQIDKDLVFVRSWVNNQGRRFVDMNSDKAGYSFSCNNDIPQCVTPSVGEHYTLRRSSKRIYKCDNVYLVDSHGKIDGIYCLEAAVLKINP